MITSSMNVAVLATTEGTTTDDALVTMASTDNSSTTTINPDSSYEENKLEVSDILNILLIATGIVIILLAIAIFIKLK
ncbi:MAG: hypothetical protein IKD76_00145 [Clostridia bacterium]|nr:hypothetical protein [Clostridia bacterium]